MTRKDYVAIAAAIHRPQGTHSVTWREYCPRSANMMRANIAETISEVMARDNPRFDRARFLKACGL